VDSQVTAKNKNIVGESKKRVNKKHSAAFHAAENANRLFLIGMLSRFLSLQDEFSQGRFLGGSIPLGFFCCLLLVSDSPVVDCSAADSPNRSS
jgi:hypothetical protein